MRKISQYWIEDPLRTITQPVQFTVEGKVDISVGAQFVRSARLLNSSNLPVFSYKNRINGTEFSYSRMFDREYVGIYSPVVGGGFVTVEEIVKTVSAHPVITFALYAGADRAAFGHYLCRDIGFSLDGYVQTWPGVVNYSTRIPEELSVVEVSNIGYALLTVVTEDGTEGTYTPGSTRWVPWGTPPPSSGGGGSVGIYTWGT